MHRTERSLALGRTLAPLRRHRNLLVVLLLLPLLAACPSATTDAPPPDPTEPMVLTVTVQAGDEIELPLNGGYAVTVDWGDGDTTTASSDGPSVVADHVYLDDGSFEIAIAGSVEGFGANSGYPGSEFVTSVQEWGTLGLESLAFAFRSAVALTSLPDELPATVTDLEGLFYDADTFNQDIGGWDVSNVENMNSMFVFASAFDQDLSGWCVPNIPSKPDFFDVESGFVGQGAKQPQWGTCP